MCLFSTWQISIALDETVTQADVTDLLQIVGCSTDAVSPIIAVVGLLLIFSLYLFNCENCVCLYQNHHCS